MGVQCQILINKAKEGVHRAGQAVKGKVRYLVDEPTEFQDVTLSLLGKGKCRWSQGSGKNRRTYVGREDCVTMHINVCNKRPDDTVTLQGKYEHPFEFFLPEDIPRSFKDCIGSIIYRIELKFVKPSFFSFNKVFTAVIPVYNYLNPITDGPTIFGLQKELFAPFSALTPIVNLKGEISKSHLIPGENAQISYVVTNDTNVAITSVRTELYCVTTYTSDCGHKRRIETRVPNCEAQSNLIPEKQVCRIQCILPTLPDLYSIPNSKVINVEYRVRATVRLPLPHFNASVDMPVLIGEVKGAVEPALEVEEDEQPPTYWEAMNDKKGGGKSGDESD